MATGRSSIYKGSDLIHDFSCSKCEENDFNKEAQHFCPDCEHYLCDKCVGLHNGYHNKHTVYGRGDVEKWVGSSIDKCDKHGKELDVHCDDHQELCCSVCVALNHRQCKSISHLPDLAKGFQKKAEFKQLSEAVEKMRCRLDELKKEKREDQAELKDSYKKIIADFKALRIEIDTILDQIEKATKEQLDNIFDDFKNDVKDDVENCVKMNDQLKNLMEKINQLTGKRKETNSYIGYRKCTAKLTQADNLIRETRRKPKEEIQFVSDRSIESFFKSMNTLGLIERKISKPNRECVYQVIESKKYNVRIQQDKNMCTITEICELPSGHIVISDGPNCNIKLLNIKFQVIDHCDLPGSPFAMCHTAASEVAVAVDNYENRHEVQLIKITEGRLQKVRKFNTDHISLSIACHLDQLYVGSETALYQYTMDGALVKKIHEDKSGDCTVFRCAINPDGERIYVSNFSGKKLIALDKDGQELSALENPELQSPSGLCVNLTGQIFVCSVESKTVIQVDCEGTRKLATTAREVDGINTPWSVGFIESTPTLVVGGYENDNIYVLPLEKIRVVK